LRRAHNRLQQFGVLTQNNIDAPVSGSVINKNIG
jgi:hypothetical protein